MKKTILFLSTTLLFGYYAKVEPYQTYNIQADISGKVIDVNTSAKATNYKGIVVRLDDYIDKIELKNLKTQLNNYKNILKSQEKILLKKEKTYKIYKNLKTKSQIEKDNKFFDYQNTLININQTKNTISNLKYQIKKLEDTIKKKHISFKHYIYDIKVNIGDFVTIGKPIATTMDISKEKLVIYVPLDKIKSIKNKIIYINNKKSNFKIDKIYKIADEKYTTSYKVELVGNGLKLSNIVEIKFKGNK